ncbi:MAG TPA: CocE/NonD family hydrolase [Actinomycetota bacterium]|nr:CocE/NonD family hydrolase [Actinomycetota bacterium]
MRKLNLVLALVLLSSILSSAVPARAASAPDAGKRWEPKPRSEALFGTKAPDEDPDVQRHYVEGGDGTDLYVETWLPAPKDGRKPPAKIPTILVMTPYVAQGVEEYPASQNGPGLIEYFTARGYAVAQHHVRGTGESGGCLEQTAAHQIEDGARVVEYLGKEAPWTNGRVGMYGASYDAETQISTAGMGDPKKVKYLKAIIPTASVGSQYDWNFMDGVPWAGQPLLGNASYLAGTSMVPGNTVAPQYYPEKLTCQGEVMGSSANQTGDYTQYWADREYRPGAPKVKAATLFVHGLRDFNVQPITAAGWFDRLPRSTPHKGLFGVWNHAFPHSHGAVAPEWERADWFDMVTAWFDRYLKGLDTDVERWPDVQIQSSDGQWWAVDEYPTMGKPAGQLALGADGTLGVSKPQGSTSYIEQLQVGTSLPGQEAVFETAPVKDTLHVAGQPVLDLWVESNLPDGHVAVKLEVIGKDGEPVTHGGSYDEFAATYGVRSLQHIEPMKKGYFAQEAGVAFPVGEPTRVEVRFLPSDLVVPKGHSLRLTVSGSVAYSKGESLPSGTSSQITILHDCDHPSVLRFLTPDPKAQLLNVREEDEVNKKLSSKRAVAGRRDGAGLASQRVCGDSPELTAALDGYRRSGR